MPRRGHRLARVVDDPGLRIAESQFGENFELIGLRDFDRVDVGPVDHRDAGPVEVAEPIEGVERGLPVAAEIGRGTRPVDDEGIGRVEVGGIVLMGVGIEPDPGDAAAIEFQKQRPEPIRVLVIDGDR